jgi:hypothetical protein
MGIFQSTKRSLNLNPHSSSVTDFEDAFFSQMNDADFFDAGQIVGYRRGPVSFKIRKNPCDSGQICVIEYDIDMDRRNIALYTVVNEHLRHETQTQLSFLRKVQANTFARYGFEVPVDFHASDESLQIIDAQSSDPRIRSLLLFLFV